MATRLRGCVAALVVAAAALGWLAGPSPALACTASRCMESFHDWLGSSPVALYRLDRSASWWTRAPHKQPMADWTGDECVYRGAFTFRRVDNIRGWSPAMITIRAPSGQSPDCPGFDMRGSWDGKTRLPGTWLVVRNANAQTFAVDAFYHLDSRARIDNDGAFPHDYPDPETTPQTLAEWYAVLGMPQTDTEQPGVSGNSAPMPSPVLLIAAALGLAAGVRRSASGSARGGVVTAPRSPRHEVTGRPPVDATGRPPARSPSPRGSRGSA